MENVLYEFNFNYFNLLWLLIPFILGVAFVFNRKLVSGGKGIPRIISIIFSVVGVAVFILGISIMSSYMHDYNTYKELLETNQVEIVEGEIEKFHAQSKEGHDTEHFEINGVYFEYSNFVVSNGYNKPKCYGGVISGNGQKLRIKYVQEESDGETYNTILYIEQPE